MIDWHLQRGRWGKILVVVLAVAFPASAVFAEDDCVKAADLWFPQPGVVLTDGGVSVQEMSGDVCQGGEVTITVTVDNLSCGDAEPFDVMVFYDDSSHGIAMQRVNGLPGCEYVTLTFTWDTDGVPPGTHEIVVVADFNEEVAELNEGNNEYTFDILVSPYAPLIEATKHDIDTDGGTPEPGDTIRYEVVIWNDGCADQEDNPGHEFVDTLPAGLSATGYAEASGGTITVSGDEIVWDGAIPAGGSVALIYKATVVAHIEEGTTICNQGIIHWDADANGSNEAIEPTDDPETSADDDPTCFTVEISGGPPPLSGTIDAPTLSEWGMIILSGSFALAFWRMVRRQCSLAAQARS